jgi:RNA polymerase sigma factor (sigma-70 family)
MSGRGRPCVTSRAQIGNAGAVDALLESSASGNAVAEVRVTTHPQATFAAPEPAVVVEQYGRLVSSICWRMTRDQDAAREAAQEVWLAVLEGLPGFRGESSLSTWIYTIARRVVGRYAQTRQTLSVRFLSTAYEADGELEPPDTPDFDHELWVREMCDLCLSGMLQCLDPDVRLAYLLREVAELDYDDVALVMEIQPDAARQMVSRARRKLNRFMSGHCALADPTGPCRCRMRRRVEGIDLPAQYTALRRTMHQARVIRESEQVLPPKDFWLELSQAVA